MYRQSTTAHAEVQSLSASLVHHLQTTDQSDGLERSPRIVLDVVHCLSCNSSVTAKAMGSRSLEASMYNENTLKQLDMAVIGVDRPYYGQVMSSVVWHCGPPQRGSALQCKLCSAASALVPCWGEKLDRDTR